MTCTVCISLLHVYTHVSLILYNSEARAPENLDNPEEMFSRHYMHSDVCNMFRQVSDKYMRFFHENLNYKKQIRAQIFSDRFYGNAIPLLTEQ